MGFWMQWLMEVLGGLLWVGVIWLLTWSSGAGPVPLWGWMVVFFAGSVVTATRIDAKRWAGKL